MIHKIVIKIIKDNVRLCECRGNFVIGGLVIVFQISRPVRDGRIGNSSPAASLQSLTAEQKGVMLFSLIF